MKRMRWIVTFCVALTMTTASAQPQQLDSKAFEDETMQHFQTLLRFETMDPPGNEKPAADYLKQVLEKEGIVTKTFALAARGRSRKDGFPTVGAVCDRPHFVNSRKKARSQTAPTIDTANSADFCHGLLGSKVEISTLVQFSKIV